MAYELWGYLYPFLDVAQPISMFDFDPPCDRDVRATTPTSGGGATEWDMTRAEFEAEWVPLYTLVP